MDPILVEMYETLKELYKSYPQVMVLTGEEYNAQESGLDFVDEDSIVVCDNPEDKYCTDEIHHIDGAFSIWIEEGTPYYQWWPYPEKPIVGKEEIINHIKQLHLPK